MRHGMLSGHRVLFAVCGLAFLALCVLAAAEPDGVLGAVQPDVSLPQRVLWGVLAVTTAAAFGWLAFGRTRTLIATDDDLATEDGRTRIPWRDVERLDLVFAGAVAHGAGGTTLTITTSHDGWRDLTGRLLATAVRNELAREPRVVANVERRSLVVASAVLGAAAIAGAVGGMYGQVPIVGAWVALACVGAIAVLVRGAPLTISADPAGVHVRRRFDARSHPHGTALVLFEHRDHVWLATTDGGIGRVPTTDLGTSGLAAMILRARGQTERDLVL